MHYIEHDGTEYYFTMNSFPAFLDKKVKLLNYFMNYMKEHLLKAGANIKMRLLLQTNICLRTNFKLSYLYF